MKKLLIILLLIVGCDEVPTSILDDQLTGTYSLTNYLWYDNADCTGESIINESAAELTLTELEYSYSFDGNSVTIIQISSGNEQFNLTCDYVIVSDIFTPGCFPNPHTLNSDRSEFTWELATTNEVSVEGYNETLTVCQKYIFTIE